MSIKITNEEFLFKAKEIHGEKYVYPEKYNGCKNKVEIICKEEGHGSFFQVPSSHLQGVGCPKCGLLKQAASFMGLSLDEYKNIINNGQRFCKVHGVQDLKDFTTGNDPHCKKCESKSAKDRNIKIRLEVLKYYSPTLSCAICGENQIKFLAIDHINGGGEEDRRSVNGCFHLYLYKQGLPDGFRILCHNCNFKYGVRYYDGSKASKKPESYLKQTKSAIKDRNYYINNQEKIRNKEKRRNKRDKEYVINHYGGKCVCCGIDDIVVLSIDHIDGGGRAHDRGLDLKGNDLDIDG
jgi:hypothetical protein